MRAFIIRPFGVKNDIDFDQVETRLIGPALERLHVAGRTTLDIVKAGNIRVDMFQRLLTADLVIADVSIHSANVFYELGIRHALRPKRTLMIRSDSDKFPFDLQTDRYFTYNKSNPAASLNDLVEALAQTINSEDPDSPVFRLLPNLEAQEITRFLAVPLDFREDVERIASARQLGDLELLAMEVRGFEWESEGLRIIGRTLFNLKAHRAAVDVWERVRDTDLLDLEANRFLATSYQRLGDLTRADQAVRRALESKRLSERTRAEFYSLLGSNAKARWKGEWQGVPDELKRARALSSGYLYESLEAYETGFAEDLNHFYSGLNALALLRVIEELAQLEPELWTGRFEKEYEALNELDSIREKIEKLSAAVSLSIGSETARIKRSGRRDIWVEISEADLCLLTSKRPPRVAAAYRDVLEDPPPFAIDSVRNQVLIYKNLGLIKDNVQAALSVIGEGATPPASAEEAVLKPTRILLFTGHMIDAPGRKNPRFPANKEGIARQAIKDAVQTELASGGVLLGIAGAASGGDILFHEICAELRVPTEVFLALPSEQYIRESVQSAGSGWIDRFHRILNSHPPRILSEARDESEYLPRWLREKPEYGIWQRNNLWMLNNALSQAEGGITLIALWDEKAGDGPGGTADVVQTATNRGAKTVILNVNLLFNP